MTVQASVNRDRARWTPSAVIGASTLILALALRLACARGDLWYDEIWTLNLLTNIGSADQIFWNISHDNNHFLNSLWMYAVGVDGSPLLFRLPSILMGLASVAVAGRIGARLGTMPGLLAAFVFALAFPFVNYGSEARGYAGLVLALLVAIDAFDGALPILQGQPLTAALNRARWWLAGALGVGALCHLTMALGVAILVGAACLIMVSAEPRPTMVQGGRRLIRLFAPSALCCLPSLAAVVAGILVHGRLTLGGTSYVPGRFATGAGGMVSAGAGRPAGVPGWIALVLVSAGICAVIYFRLLPRAHLFIALTGLVLIPAAIAVVNPPNTENPRYFMACGTVLALLAAEAAGRAGTTRVGRWLVPILVAGFVAGQVGLDARLAVFGRGKASDIVATMAAQPGSTYAAPFFTAPQLTFDYYAYRQGLTLTRVPLPLTCAAKPDWYIDDAPPISGAPPATLTLGPQACPMIFTAALDVPTSSFSGRHWTLFRRQ